MDKKLFDREEYRKFLSRHDMIFEKPAGQWEQGVPMGNGLLGTVVWGGGDLPMRISLDRADIWELRNIHFHRRANYPTLTFQGPYRAKKARKPPRNEG